MPARTYNQPTAASSGSDSTALLSVPTYVDEALTMMTHTEPFAVPVHNAMLEATAHLSDVQPAAGDVADQAFLTPDYRPGAEAAIEPGMADLPPSDDVSDDASTPAALPSVLVQTIANQTQRKKKKNVVERLPVQRETTARDEDARTAEEAIVESSLPVDQTTPLSPVDDPNNPDWKGYWPTNELVMYAVLDPSTAQAPTVDGVRLIRTQAQITEIDPETSDVGIVAKVPVQILPMARGYEPLYNEITRARRTKQRVRPFIVEMRGVCKRLADQDSRFTTTRRTTLFGMQISTVKRIDKDHMQFGRWRGRGTVSAVRPFELDGMDYYRVTLEVASMKRKVFLRGESAQVDPVDVLVRKDHAHAARFRRVGQRLLVEAEITAQTSIMRDTHPALEGLDDESRQRLAMIRQGIVLANMGEFPDVQAEQDFANWERTGTGNPGRPGRGRRVDGTGTGRHGNTAPRSRKQRRNSERRQDQQPVPNGPKV